MLFDPIDHESVADAVIHQIESLVVSGVLKEGQKLPSERDMAELFDVSRPKLREALKTLEERGLIRVQHGEGTFIAPLIGSAMSPALMDLYKRHASAFYDYLEYRREQEGFAARLAAERATAADREIIAQILKDMTVAHKIGDEEASKTLDMQLHTAIVDSSHNATLVHMMSSIYELTRSGVFYNRDYLTREDQRGDKLLAQHTAIGQAVLNGDPECAKAAALEHLDYVEASFLAGERRRQREHFAEKRMLLHKPSSAR